ncbi:phage tail assembly chaperone [Cronobacter dublinensis]|uniref:phage tail assembly chaperone n=1 Tax=Cronobacter dublinensis TaxID=413497 RepID=UPI003899A4DC
MSLNTDNQAALFQSTSARTRRTFSNSYWAMIPDAPTDKEAWGAYRKALREVPQQDGFPEKLSGRFPRSP